MERPASLPKVTAPPPRSKPFRWIVVITACLLLLAYARELGGLDIRAFFLLFGIVFLSQSVPVVVAAEKRVTFTAAFVFAAALLVGGTAAGWIALIACIAHGWLLSKDERSYGAFVGAQYALAALASHRVWAYYVGAPSVTPSPDLADIADAALAAIAFIAVKALLEGLESLGTGRSSRAHTEQLIRLEAVTYLASFPFAMLMAFAYRSFGLAAVPCLAALLLVCAHAVRMTVEYRSIKIQLEAVDELGQTCANAVSPEVPLQQFLSLAHKLLEFDKAILWLKEQNSAGLVSRGAFPEGAAPLVSDDVAVETLISRASRRLGPILIPDASRDPRLPEGRAAETWILYPMILHGQPVGVVQFIRDAARTFTSREAGYISALVPQAAVAIESTRVRHLMHRYADMAITDGLTGLMNHGRAYEVLLEELDRAARYDRPLAVLMLDVDSFKHFNDTYGHPQGDKLLKGISNILKASVRSVDHVGRYGGEEFIIILPETSRDESLALAERIRSAVEREGFPAGDGTAVRKTLSIGIAGFPMDASQPADLVKHADEALYRAKRTGKNKVLTA